MIMSYRSPHPSLLWGVSTQTTEYICIWLSGVLIQIASYRNRLKIETACWMTVLDSDITNWLRVFLSSSELADTPET